MANEIITYWEMCAREGRNFQRGMHYLAPQNHSVILMSRRRNAPYNDRLEDGVGQLSSTRGMTWHDPRAL